MRLKGHRTIAPLCLAGFLLAACSSDYVNRNDKISLDVGDAVAHNKAVHIIDPWPHHAERIATDTDSARMIVAIEKHEKGPDTSSSAGKAPTTTTN
jgi:hypothetical protein